MTLPIYCEKMTVSGGRKKIETNSKRKQTRNQKQIQLKRVETNAVFIAGAIMIEKHC